MYPNNFPFIISSKSWSAASERLKGKFFRICFLTFLLVMYSINPSHSHISMTVKLFSPIELRLNSSSSLSFNYHVEYHCRWELIALPDRDRSGKGSPLLRKYYCIENKNHQHWSSQFPDVCLSYGSSRFCNLVLFVQNRTWAASGATGLVLSSCESICLCIEIPTRLMIGRHGLTLRIWI